MLGTTITIPVNAVNKVLNRVNDSEPYSATYFLAEANVEYQVTIKHTIPKTRGASKESHLVRLDVTDYDATSGDLVRKQSVWTVIETSVGRQDDTTAGYYVAGLDAFLDATVTGKVLARQS